MGVYLKMLLVTLLVGLLGGVVGILVDLDHFIAYRIKHSGRVLHPYLLTVSIVVLCSLLAYLGGLLS